MVCDFVASYHMGASSQGRGQLWTGIEGFVGVYSWRPEDKVIGIYQVPQSLTFTFFPNKVSRADRAQGVAARGGRPQYRALSTKEQGLQGHVTRPLTKERAFATD